MATYGISREKEKKKKEKRKMGMIINVEAIMAFYRKFLFCLFDF